jgi:hypothetical protein
LRRVYGTPSTRSGFNSLLRERPISVDNGPVAAAHTSWRLCDRKPPSHCLVFNARAAHPHISAEYKSKHLVCTGHINRSLGRMATVGACSALARAAVRGLSTRHNVIRRNVLRKVRRGIDRLPTQGPDPAISDVTPNGWRIAAAAVVERYPVVMPDPHPFAAKYLEGRFLWQQSVARPIPESWFESDRDESGGTYCASLTLVLCRGRGGLSLTWSRLDSTTGVVP